jgi:hypothetical protein
MHASAADTLTHLVYVVTHASKLAYVSWGVGVVMAALLFRPFFQDFSGFGECIRYWFQPDLWSLFRGEWLEDQWAQLKLFLWVAISAVAGVAAYFKLPTLLPVFFPA